MHDNRNSHEESHGGLGYFFLLVFMLLILAGAAGLFYGSLTKEKPKDLSDTTVESFDLSEESKTAHHTIDEILMRKRENWQLRDTERRKHKDMLETSKADLVWTDREVAVGVPVTTELQGASLWVQERLRDTDVKIINDEKSKWHGMPSWRLELGIAVKSGKDSERIFTTDTIYFFHHGNMTNRDRDIPDIPSSADSKDEQTEKKQNESSR